MLVKRHQRVVYGLMCHLTHNESIAEDLTQETFVHAWEKLSTFRASGSFTAWLSRLAYTRFLRYYRRNKLEQKYIATLRDSDEPSARLKADLDFQKYLSVCSQDECHTLLLYYMVGLNSREIGAAMNLPTGTVKSLLHRAKVKIRDKFKFRD